MLLIVGAALFMNSAKMAADSWCSTVYKWCQFIVGAQHIFLDYVLN